MQLYNGSTIDVPLLDKMENVLTEAKGMLQPGESLMESTASAKATAAFVGYGIGLGRPPRDEEHPVTSLVYHTVADMYKSITQGNVWEQVEELRQYFHDAFIVQLALRSDESLGALWVDMRKIYMENVKTLDDMLDVLESPSVSNAGNC